jgi:hypothetical protein
MAERAFLSKSTFIRGIQCEKSLYLHKKRPFLRDRLSAELLAKFSRGHRVGYLARDLFPGGVDVSPKSHFQMGTSIKKTAEHIKAGVPVIYEASFEYSGVRVALDILHKDRDSYKAIEVKSSAAISETYLWDASLQYFVITKSGLPIDDFFLAYINYGYIRNGDIDMSKLFIIESVLELVKSKQDAVAEKIEQLRKIPKMTKSPVIPVGPHCHNPYPCDFIGHCWRHIPPETGFDQNSFYAETSKVCGETLKEPVGIFSSLYYKPAIPPYDGSSPYQKLAISYGHDMLEKEDSSAKILTVKPGSACPESDIWILINDLERYNSILVFDKDAETDRISFLLKEDAELQHRLSRLSEKMIDMQAPFSHNRVFSLQQKLPEHPEDAAGILTGKPNTAPGNFSTRLEVSVWYESMSENFNESEWLAGVKDLEFFHQNNLAIMKRLCQVMKEL